MAIPVRPLGLSPSKIVAVHLNYRSRAEERGRTPATPSYFFKPASSLAGDGEPIVRPPGCELLCYEGEIALVIGTAARRVSVAEAERSIGWITAANDVGVYDLRWADRGSNVLAKGQDGFTPIGPRLVPAADLRLDDLTLRTFVNGSLVQEGHSSELIFPFALLIADLSRFMTLEPGDVILTGTPANSRPLSPGDVVEIEIERRRPDQQRGRRGRLAARADRRHAEGEPRDACGCARRQRATLGDRPGRRARDPPERLDGDADDTAAASRHQEPLHRGPAGDEA